jgi:hypothetical protein
MVGGAERTEEDHPMKKMTTTTIPTVIHIQRFSFAENFIPILIRVEYVGVYDLLR